MMLWKRFEWIISLFVSTAYCCTSTNKYIRLGNNVELYFKAVTVSSENPALPISNFILSPYDSQMLAVTYVDGNFRINSSCFNCTFTGDTATGNITIRLDNVQRSSGGTYKHAVENKNTIRDCVSVFILGVPSKPKITSNKDPSVRDNVSLSCSSTSTTTPNTHALHLVYNWRFDGTDNPSDSRYLYSTYKKTLTLFNVVKADSSKRFTCTAKEEVENGYTSVSSDSFSLNVLYGPDNLTFRPYEIYYEKEENRNLDPVTCKAECNPMCTFTRKKLDKGIVTDVSSSAVLNLEMLTSTDAGIYQCKAVRQGTSYMYVTKNLTVDVIYGPEQMELMPATEVYKENENSSLQNITCSSDCYVCKYSWTGPNSFSSNVPVLSLGRLSRKMAGNYSCTARNTKASQHTLQRKGIKVEVRFGPDFVSFTPEDSNYTVDEDTNLRDIQCSAVCFPDCTFTWTKEGQFEIVSRTDTLSLGNIQRSDAGNYTCTAFNGDSPSKFMKRSVSINVRDTSIRQTFYIEGHINQQNVKVDEHDAEIQFKCIVKSNPQFHIRILFEEDVLVKQVSESSLSFFRRDVSCFDAGVYTCEGSNEFGRKSTHNITLFVQCSPRPLRQIERNVSSYLYSVVMLSVSVIAYPPPGTKGFSWSKEESVGWLPLLSNTDLKISSSSLQSNLTLFNISRGDFGLYKVTVINTIGSYEQHIFLSEKKVSEQHLTDGQCMRQTSEKTALIVGLILGALCCIVIIYATYVTILKNRLLKKVSSSLDRSGNESRYANPTFASNVTEGEGYDGNTKSDHEASFQQYTDLSRYANTDTYTYDVIKRT